MQFNDLGCVTEQNIRRWTKQAIECFKNGMVCAKCNIPEDLKEGCKMKPCVLELVKKFGKPDEELKNGFEEVTDKDGILNT